MENTEKRIVEINGVKLEIDLRTARAISEYRVGDNIKVLVKEYQDYKVCPGVIVSFDEFKSLPTLTIAYIGESYSPQLRFVAFNSESKGIEISPAGDDIKLDKSFVLAKMDREISQKEYELKNLLDQKRFFEEKFQQYFEKKGE